MPVQVVGGDVEQDRDIESKRGDQLELKGARLDDVGPLAAERRKGEGRRAEIATHLDRPSGTREDVADQRGRCRFAIRASYSNIAGLGLSSAQEFEIADDQIGRAHVCTPVTRGYLV